MSTPFASYDDAIAEFTALEQRFRASGDRRAIFLTLYGIVSAEMRTRIAARAFADNEWVHRYGVAFANRYRSALDAYDAGLMAQVPKAWRLCFDAARRGSGVVLQDLLLGINAHVNNDLAQALDTVSIDPDRQRRYDDHCRVNDVLRSVTDRATQRLTALYAPGFASLDECAGSLDEMLSAFSLQVARESAWEGAVALANARGSFERSLATTMIESRAAVMAKLLLAPSLDPVAMAACRRIEAGPEWLTVLADLHRELTAT